MKNKKTILVVLLIILLIILIIWFVGNKNKNVPVDVLDGVVETQIEEGILEDDSSDFAGEDFKEENESELLEELVAPVFEQDFSPASDSEDDLEAAARRATEAIAEEARNGN